MKIVLIGPVYPYRGGIAQYTTLLTQALSECHQLDVLSFSRQYPAWLYPGNSDKDLDQRLPKVPAHYLLDSINPYSWWRTAAWVKQNKPDLLIIQWWVTFLAPAYSLIARLCRRAGIPVLFMIHNVFPHEGGGIHPLLAKLALSQGSFFLVHTKVQSSLLTKLLPNAQVAVCPFPAFTSFTKQVQLPDRQNARQRLGLPQVAPILLFFGIVRPYKGLRYLIDAVNNLHERGLRTYLLVAGEFWENIERYQQKISAYGLTDYIRFENRYIPDEEVGLFFAASDICVAPYVGGTQSAVVALAQAYGRPVVMTDLSAAGVDTARVDPRTIVPPADANALADAIQYQLAQPESSDHRSNDSGTGWENVLAIIERFIRK